MIARVGEGRVHKNGIRAHFHRLRRVRRRPKPSVHDDGNGALFDDDAEHIPRFHPAIASDRRAQRHDRSRPHFLQPLRQDRIGLDIRQNGKALLYEYLRCLQRLDRIRQEVPWLRRQLQFYPRLEPSSAGKLRQANGFLRRSRARGVRENQLFLAVQRWHDAVFIRAIQIHPPQRYSNDFRLGCRDGIAQRLGIRKLSRSNQKPRVKRTVRDNQRVIGGI